MSRIFVTGIGVISAIGQTVELNHRSLIQGASGIGILSLLPTRFAGKLPCGEIKITTEVLQDTMNRREPGTTRTSLLALHAFKEAIADAGLDPDQVSAPDTALIGATTVGGMCLTDELYHDANADAEGSAYLSSYDGGSVILYLQSCYNMTGIANTINTACSSSANAIMYGARLIKNGFARRAIVGGSDSLAKFTINGFNALHILSPEIATPFDQGRKGLNLGEGAAFLVLEREQDAVRKVKRAELKGYFNSNDAFHPSSLSENGEGPYLSMKGALASAQLEPAHIGFINAHGTGTENNDESESRAMIRLFEKIPPFASTKSFTGHTLGAAGAMEAVFSVLSLQFQEFHPSLHFRQVIASTKLTPVTKYSKMVFHHVMSNSFGFGGNCTSLIFSKV